MEACYYDKLAVVKFLIDKYIFIQYLQNKEGKTGLYFLEDKNRLKIEQYINGKSFIIGRKLLINANV